MIDETRASSSAYSAISAQHLMHRGSSMLSEQAPLLQGAADIAKVEADSILLQDIGRPLLDTIVQYKHKSNISSYHINDALEHAMCLITERHMIFHPTPIARIQLKNGNVFMMLVNDEKAKQLHIKIYDPSTSLRSPYANQVLRKSDLEHLQWSIRPLVNTIHKNTGAWESYAWGKSVPLPESTIMHVALPD